jgi:hypothetical protein
VSQTNYQNRKEPQTTCPYSLFLPTVRPRKVAAQICIRTQKSVLPHICTRHLLLLPPLTQKIFPQTPNPSSSHQGRFRLPAVGSHPLSALYVATRESAPGRPRKTQSEAPCFRATERSARPTTNRVGRTSLLLAICHFRFSLLAYW